MKTNHRRGFKASAHIHNILHHDKIMDKELGVIADNWTCVHYGPGREGFIGAKRGAKRAGHAKVRTKLRDVLIDEVKDVNTNGTIDEKA